MVTARLLIVIGSTRPRRVGPSVAAWFESCALELGTFDVTTADLAAQSLPMFDEPRHPWLRRYEHDHTKAWSAIVGRADAVVWILPEYNHSFNAATKNALDYLNAEWADKPIGLVSYGGVAAGTRAVQALKPVLVALRMIVVPTLVHIPFVHTRIEHGLFVADDALNESAQDMLNELLRWHERLTPIRSERDAAVGPSA